MYVNVIFFYLFIFFANCPLILNSNILTYMSNIYLISRNPMSLRLHIIQRINYALRWNQRAEHFIYIKKCAMLKCATDIKDYSV